MQKIACIFSFKESNWVSCQKIVFNLHKAYQAIPQTELRNFNLSNDSVNLGMMESMAKELVAFEPDSIVIMDHQPHPIYLLQGLSNLYKNIKKPKIIFHIFGDFTIYYNLWEKLGKLLEGFTVEFLVASDRQKILIDRMLAQNTTTVCPFPVNPKEFYPDQNLRIQQRTEWQLGEKDVAFIFTGRLSRQKRIKTLITSFASEFKNDPHAHLYFYGSHDNIGDPFLGIKDIEGEYFRIFYHAYKELPLDLQKRIHFKGSVPNADLLKVYQGADVFMNLSVHNDEDYGMSVAEAQFVGLPIGLTDWGGLASFHHPQLPEATSFIPVKIGLKSKHVSIKGVKNTLRKFFTNPERDKRVAISEAANQKFGIERASTIIQDVLQKDSKEFGGYSPLFFEASLAYQFTPSEPMFLTHEHTLNKLYRDIYSAYARNY